MELCSIYLFVGLAHVVWIHSHFSVVFYCVNISQLTYPVYWKLTFEYFPGGVSPSDAALSIWSFEDIGKHTWAPAGPALLHIVPLFITRILSNTE